MDIVQLKNMEPIFGSWHVDREIGSGSFGKVYAVYKDDAGMRFWAALKIITIPSNDNEIQELDAQGFDYQGKIRYFDNIAAGITEEIRIMNTLRGYSNIVCFEDHQTIMHADGIGRDILIRMELLQRLDDYMRRIRATQYDVICMLRDIAQALVLCDKRNIIHRDIKPDNIMVSENGDYKLVDFGIARNMEKTNQASTKAGSYPYMAPEVQMHQPYGKSVDIYSLGIVAYRELNAYRYPFLPPYPLPFTAEDRDQALVRRFRGEKLPPIPGVSKQVFSIIEKSTAPKPDHRYSSAMDLLNDLQSVMNLPELKKKYIYDESGNLLMPGGTRVDGRSFADSSSRTGSQSSRSQMGGTGSQSSRTQMGSIGGSQSSRTQIGSIGGSQSSRSMSGRSEVSVRSVQEKPKGGSMGKKIALTAAGVMLVASVGLVFLVLRNKDDDNGAKPAAENTPLIENTPLTANQPETAVPMDLNKTYWSSGLKENASARIEAFVDGRQVECALWQNTENQPYLGKTLPERGYYLVLPDYAATGVHSLRVVVYDENGAETGDSVEKVFQMTQVDGTEQPDFTVLPTQITLTAMGARTQEGGLYTYDANAGWVTVSGDAMPGLTVRVRYGASVSEDIRVQDDGHYSYSVNVSSLLRNEVSQFQAYYPYLEGSGLPTASIQVLYDAPFRFQVDADASSATRVLGTAEPGAAVYLQVNSRAYETKASESGEFRFENLLLSKSDTISLYMQDENGNQSEAILYTVHVPLELDAQELTENTLSISGSADAGNRVTIQNQQGETLGNSIANSQGRFTVPVNGLKTGDTIYAKAVDAASNESEAVLVGTVQRGELAPITFETHPALETVGAETYLKKKSSLLWLTGSAKKNTDLTVSLNGGAAVAVQTRDNGEWECEFDIDGLEEGGRVSIHASYAQWPQEQAADVSFVLDTECAVRLGADPVSGDTEIKVYTDPGATVRIYVDGQLIRTMMASAQGELSAAVPALSGGASVRVEAEDAAGNTGSVEKSAIDLEAIARENMIAIECAQCSADGYINGSVEAEKITFTGHAKAGRRLAAAVRDEDGHQVGISKVVTVEQGGSWVWEVSQDALSDGQRYTAEVRYTDDMDNSASFSFQVDRECERIRLIGEVTTESTAISGSTEAGAAVRLMLGSGSTDTTANDQGRFSFPVEGLEAGTAYVIQATDPAGNEAERLSGQVGQEKRTKVTVHLNNSVENGYLKDTIQLSGVARPERELALYINGERYLDGFAADGSGALGQYAVSMDLTEYTGSDAQLMIWVGYADGIGESSEPVTGQYVKRTALSAAIYSGNRLLQDGDAIGQDTMLVTLREETARPVAVTLAGADMQLKGTFVDGAAVFNPSVFKDGDILRLTVSYADDDSGAYSFTASYQYDCSTQKPVVDQQDLTVDTTVLSGEAEPGAQVNLSINDVPQGARVTDALGRFSFDGLTLEAGQVVELWAVDSLNNASTSLWLNVRAPEAVLCESVEPKLKNDYLNGQAEKLEIKGTAEEGRTLEFYLNDGKIAEGGAINGVWQLQLSAAGLSAGAEYAIRVQYAGEPDSAYELRFIYDPACEEIALDTPIDSDSTAITGSTEPGAALRLINSSGRRLYNGKANADGSFSIPLESALRQSGASLRLQAEDSAGNSTEITIQVARAERSAITIDLSGLVAKPGEEGTYLLRDDVGQVALSGYAQPGQALSVIYQMDTRKTTAHVTSAEDGSWKSTGQLRNGWSTASIRVDYAGGDYPEQGVSLLIQKDDACVLTADVDFLQENSASLPVRSEQGATLRLLVNGKAVGSPVTLEAEDSHVFALSGLNPGDQVEVQATDLVGNTASLSFPVQLEERQEPTIVLDSDTGVVGVEDREIIFRGTAEPNRPLEIYLEGTMLSSPSGVAPQNFIVNDIAADDNGQWFCSVNVADFSLSGDIEEQFVYLVRYADRDDYFYGGEFVYDRLVTPFALDSAAVDEDTTAVSGQVEEGALITLVTPGGDVYSATSMNGRFELRLSEAMNAGESLAITAKDAAGNTARQTLRVTAAQRSAITLDIPNLTQNRLKAGALRASGSMQAGKDIAVRVYADGQLVNETVVSSASGKWTYEKSNLVQDGVQYTVAVAYADGKSPSSAVQAEFVGDGACQPITGMPDMLKDTTVEISGATEAEAKVTLAVNGREASTVTADGSGRFRFTGLSLQSDDMVSVYAVDAVGNESAPWTAMVETGKERITDGSSALQSPTNRGPDKPYAQRLNVTFQVFSHEKQEFYFTLSSNQGTCRYDLEVPEDYISYGADAVETAKSYKVDLDKYSVKYGYEMSENVVIKDLKFEDTGEALPDGEYTFSLFAQAEGSKEVVKIGDSITLSLQSEANPKKKTDYVHEYSSFALGLDEPVTATFPSNEILMTGWIFAPEKTVVVEGDSGSVTYGIVIYLDNSNSPIDNVFYENNFVIRQAYRNVAKEHPEYAAKYGQPDTDLGGIAVQILLNGDLALSPGKHTIKLCLDDINFGGKPIAFGTYEITISNDGSVDASFDGAAAMQRKINEWMAQ